MLSSGIPFVALHLGLFFWLLIAINWKYIRRYRFAILVMLPWAFTLTLVGVFKIEFYSFNSAYSIWALVLLFFSVLFTWCLVITMARLMGAPLRRIIDSDSLRPAPVGAFFRRFFWLSFLASIAMLVFLSGEIYAIVDAFLTRGGLHQIRAQMSGHAQIDTGIGFVVKAVFSFTFLIFGSWYAASVNLKSWYRKQSIIARCALLVIVLAHISFALAHAARLPILAISLAAILSYGFHRRRIGVKTKAMLAFGFSFFLLMFSMRSRESDYVGFYKDLFGVVEVGVFFDALSACAPPLSVLILYLTHPISKFSEFLEYYLSSDFFAAGGGYQFNLIFRLLQGALGIEDSSIFSYRGIDPSIGYYGTFLRDMIADFTVVGAILQLTFMAIFFAFLYHVRWRHWILDSLFSWFGVFFLLAPIVNIFSSGFINISISAGLFVAFLWLQGRSFTVVAKRI